MPVWQPDLNDEATNDRSSLIDVRIVQCEGRRRLNPFKKGPDTLLIVGKPKAALLQTN